MNEVEPIDPDLARLLEAERPIDAPADAMQSRMLARLEGVLPPLGSGGGSSGGGHGHGGGGGGAPAMRAAKAAASTTAGKAIGSIALVAIGAVAGAGLHAAATGTSLAPHESAMVAAPPRIVLSVGLPERAPIEPSSSASAESTATAAAPERPATEAPGRSERELKAERLLLTTARTALARQDFASARAAVERDAREFPHGQLSEEREVLRVQILKAAGDDSAASERAAAFKKSFPKSMQQDAVDQAAAPGKKR